MTIFYLVDMAVEKLSLALEISTFVNFVVKFFPFDFQHICFVFKKI
jgi:hypothetical protein